VIYFDNRLLTYNLENLGTSLRMNVDTNVNVCIIVTVSLSLHEKLGFFFSPKIAKPEFRLQSEESHPCTKHLSLDLYISCSSDVCLESILV